VTSRTPPGGLWETSLRAYVSKTPSPLVGCPQPPHLTRSNVCVNFA
jgi:hypothetical protein